MDGHIPSEVTHAPGLSGRYTRRERHTKSKVVKTPARGRASSVNSDASEFLIRKINYVLTAPQMKLYKTKTGFSFDPET